MRRIEWITGVTAVLAVAVWFLPEGRLAAWVTLGVLYFLVCSWGSLEMRSRVFAIARWRGTRDRPFVALTFDDGPDPDSTPALLDLLKERGIQAAFFVIGEKVRRHPDLVRRCHEEGHLVENHTERHSPFTNWMVGRWLREELARCQQAVQEATGREPRYYRPPYGLVNQSVPGACRRLGLELIGWEIRSLDATPLAVATVTRRVERALRPGAVVLLHDGAQPVERVLEITAGVLDSLDRRGLQPVRLDRLLDREWPGSRTTPTRA